MGAGLGESDAESSRRRWSRDTKDRGSRLTPEVFAEYRSAREYYIIRPILTAPFPPGKLSLHSGDRQPDGERGFAVPTGRNHRLVYLHGYCAHVVADC